MKQNIIEPADVSQFIQFEHTDGPDCMACRRPDRTKRSEGRLHHKIKAFNADLDALAHCQHAQTKTILLMQRCTETERGVALELTRDVEQCIGCGRVLCDKAV